MSLFDPPFFVTHYSDWAAKQDARNNLIDYINQSNLVIARIGGICDTHKYIDKPEYKKCTECGMMNTPNVIGEEDGGFKQAK